MVIDNITTPTPKEPVEIIAIALSPFVLAPSLILKSKKATPITIGIDTNNGDKLNAVENDNAPNPTFDNPCPIIEYFLNTKLTPNIEEQREINVPTIKALTIKEYENISDNMVIINYFNASFNALTFCFISEI